MNIKCLAVAMIVSTGVAMPASAQHHHHGHLSQHTPWHQNHVLVDPHGHRVVQHHDHFRFVIPSRQQHQTTYYTHENVHYAYSVPPVVLRRGVQFAELPVAPVRPAAISFGGFSHVDDLSGRLEFLTNELCLDLHYNYPHNRGYAETYREAYEILQAAKFAHAKEHQQDREALARTLAQVDPLFHHVNEEVAGWSRRHVRLIGSLGMADKLQQMESLIHHLLHDVGVRPEHDAGNEQAPPPGGGREEAPPPPGAAAPISTPPPAFPRP